MGVRWRSLLSGQRSAAGGEDPEPGNRWFPGQPPTALHFDHAGWLMANGDRWDPERCGEGVDLVSLRLESPQHLALTFQGLGSNESTRIDFPGVTDLAIDGSFDLGRTPNGWEVLGTQMVRAERNRDDGRQVYSLELSNSGVTFASLLGSPSNE